jgi:hypothetical protein
MDSGMLPSVLFLDWVLVMHFIDIIPSWILSHHAEGQAKYWVELDPDWDYRTLTLSQPRILSHHTEGQAKYWVELDPDWDYHTLTYDNYPAFFDKTVKSMEPGPTATDNPASISAFRDRGSKLVMWHVRRLPLSISLLSYL